MEDRVIRLDDGRELGFSLYGPSDGTPVLFCHTLPGCRLQPAGVEPMTHKLGVLVVAPDRPGFGLSEFQPRRALLDWPRDGAAAMDSLGIERFHLLGASSGGVYALATCLAMPERILGAGIVTGVTPRDEAGIINVAAPRLVHWGVRHSIRFSRLVHAVLIQGMRHKPEQALDTLKRTLSAPDQAVLDSPEGSSFIIAASLEAARNGVRGWVYDDWLLNRPWGFSPSDISPSYPFHLFWGDDDLAIPLRHGEELAHEVPGAQLRVFPGDGHFSAMFERSEEVMTELLA
jgi:pimeloyl-ACP methyl ester carboxylesterase